MPKHENDFTMKKSGTRDSWCKKCHNTRTLEFKRTKSGVVGDIYNTQKSSSKKRGHTPPEYTKQELKVFMF